MDFLTVISLEKYVFSNFSILIPSFLKEIYIYTYIYTHTTHIKICCFEKFFYQKGKLLFFHYFNAEFLIYIYIKNQRHFSKNFINVLALDIYRIFNFNLDVQLSKAFLYILIACIV